MKRINEPITVPDPIEGPLGLVGDYPYEFIWRDETYTIVHIISVWHEEAGIWLDQDDAPHHVNESWLYRVQAYIADAEKNPNQDMLVLDLFRDHEGNWKLMFDWEDN